MWIHTLSSVTIYRCFGADSPLPNCQKWGVENSTELLFKHGERVYFREPSNCSMLLELYLQAAVFLAGVEVLISVALAFRFVIAGIINGAIRACRISSILPTLRVPSLVA